MSLYAIHESTGKSVPAYKLSTDATWMAKSEDKWILPDCEIENLLEVRDKKIIPYCTFVKAHVRDGEPVQPHFRSINNLVRTYSPESESEEHKLAKEFIYYTILQNELEFNIGGKIVKPSELPSYNLFIEKTIGIKRADVLLIFDKEHEILGKGIVIEVQLSYQTLSKTNKRSFDRALQGYSCVWLTEANFNKIGLVNKELKVSVFRQILEEYSEVLDNEALQRIAFISSSVEEKIDTLQKIMNSIDNSQIIWKRQQEEFVKKYEEIIKNNMYETNKKLIQESSSSLKAHFDIMLKEVKEYASKEKVSSLELIKNQQEQINIQFEKAKEYINKVTFERLNNFNQEQNQKIENILNKKIDEGLTLIAPKLSQLLDVKLREEQYMQQINSHLKEGIVNILDKRVNAASEEQVAKALQDHIDKRIDNFDKMMWLHIKSKTDLVIDKIAEQATSEVKEKATKHINEMNSLLPELKKMAHEYLKNRVEEVLNEKRSEKNKD